MRTIGNIYCNFNRLKSLILIPQVIFFSAFFFSCSLPSNNNEEKALNSEKESLLKKELELKQKELDLRNEELKLLQNGNQTNSDTKSFSATELFSKYNKSVFKIFVLDNSNELFATGTGFLMGNEGCAVTNYHVLKDATKAYIELYNGEIIDINLNKILSYDSEKDFIVFKLVTKTKLNGFEDYSDQKIEVGTQVYAIGNPAGGVTNTISQGLVTGQDFKDLQFSAPIDHGSSGSPLFTNDGKIIGLVWGGKHEGNLYRAVKIMHLELHRFIKHDSSKYNEENDPNFAGPFTGESKNAKLTWAISKTFEEAKQYLIINRRICSADLSIDGNGVAYWVDKYHDPDYGQIEFNFSYSNHFNEDVSLMMLKHGQKLYSKDLKYINFDSDKGLFSIIVTLQNGDYVTVKTQYNEKLFKEYGHIK